jgi:O-antigen/teichoic acid export membrane protein
MWLVPQAIATAVTAPVMAAQDEAGAAALVARSSLRALALTVLVAGAVAAVAPFAIPAAFGRAFDGAVTPLELLLPGVCAYAPVTVLVVYLSVRRARPLASLAVSVVSMLVTVGTALLLIPGHGARGAASASTIGYVGGAVLAWALFAFLARRPEARRAILPA